MPGRSVGGLMSFEPAAAGLIGFVVDSEKSGIRALFAITLVTGSAAGSSAVKVRGAGG